MTANGTLRLAWPPRTVSTSLRRGLTTEGKTLRLRQRRQGRPRGRGPVARDENFALLTRVADRNKGEGDGGVTARYIGARKTLRTKRTGTASHDTAPLFDGQVAWNGTGVQGRMSSSTGPAGTTGTRRRTSASQGAKPAGSRSRDCAATTRASPCTRSVRRVHLPLLRRPVLGPVRRRPSVLRTRLPCAARTCRAGHTAAEPSGAAPVPREAVRRRYATAFASRGAAHRHGRTRTMPTDAAGR